MRKLLWTAVALAAALVCVAPGAGLCADPAPYVLGFSVGVTGRRAEMGIAVKRGALIALDKINAAGGVNGRQLKAVFYDSQSQPVANVKNTKRIIDVDKAVACMGYIAVGGTLASVQTASDGETPAVQLQPGHRHRRQDQAVAVHRGAGPENRLGAHPGTEPPGPRGQEDRLPARGHRLRQAGHRRFQGGLR